MTNFFDYLNPHIPELEDSWKNDVIIAPFPLPDKDGNKIILMKFRDCTDNFNYVNCARYMLMSCFYIVSVTESKTGFVSILDCSVFTLSHWWKSSFTDVKNYSNFGKYGSPLRLVKFACINAKPMFKSLLACIKPLLSKDVIDVLSLHSDPSSFFGSMPKEAVPVDYGGSAPSIEELHWDYVRLLKNNADWIVEEANIRAVEKKKSGGWWW